MPLVPRRRAAVAVSRVARAARRTHAWEPVNFVGPDLESHKVGEIVTRGLLQSRKDVIWRADDAEVDLLRRASALEAEL